MFHLQGDNSISPLPERVYRTWARQIILGGHFNLEQNFIFWAIFHGNIKKPLFFDQLKGGAKNAL